MRKRPWDFWDIVEKILRVCLMFSIIGFIAGFGALLYTLFGMLH